MAKIGVGVEVTVGSKVGTEVGVGVEIRVTVGSGVDGLTVGVALIVEQLATNNPRNIYCNFRKFFTGILLWRCECT
jgi:hypothetical protein